MLGGKNRSGPVGRVSDHPVKTASLVGVLVAAIVLVVGALSQPGVSASNASGFAVALGEVAVARPAYPVLALVGIVVLVRG